MDLNKILPSDDNWSFSKGIIYFKKIQKIPICILIDDVPHVILENKLPKKVIELNKRLMINEINFYFRNQAYTRIRFYQYRTLQNTGFGIIYSYGSQ